MKSLLLTFLIAPLLIGCQDTHLIKAKIAQSPKTFCNPVNLNYRFMKIDGGEGIREAADPVVVSFKDNITCLPLSRPATGIPGILRIGNMSSSPIPCCR